MSFCRSIGRTLFGATAGAIGGYTAGCFMIDFSPRELMERFANFRNVVTPQGAVVAAVGVAAVFFELAEMMENVPHNLESSSIISRFTLAGAVLGALMMNRTENTDQINLRPQP